jgi:hypothetical protein
VLGFGMNRTTLANGAAAILLAAPYPICRAQSVEDRLRALESQNENLRQQLAGQQTTIDDLKRRLDDAPGRVDVFCSIHSKMSCVLLVLENPYFGVSDSSGRYKIENIPSGVYRLKAWHERLPAETREITVAESGEVRVDFVLGIKGLPQY